MRAFITHFSAIAFFGLGAAIFSAIFLLRSDIFPDFFGLFLRIIDLPFLFFALFYGGLSLRNFFEEEHHPVLDGAIVLLGMLFFALFLFGNLAYPDLM